jgi:hypothetical protein
LNGFTQLLIMLGTLADGGPSDLSVHFLDCTDDTLAAWKDVKLRDSYMLTPHIAYGGIKDVLQGSGSTRFTHKLVAGGAAVTAPTLLLESSGSKGLDNLRGTLPTLGSENHHGRVNSSLLPQLSVQEIHSIPGVMTASTSSCVEYLGTVGGYWPAIDVSAVIIIVVSRLADLPYRGATGSQTRTI